MNKTVGDGDNSKELAVRKLFRLAGASVMRGCLTVFEDEVWVSFMKKEVPVTTVRDHIRSRFCIPDNEKANQAIEQIISEVPLR